VVVADSSLVLLPCLRLRAPPFSSLFPYTTLFRSRPRSPRPASQPCPPGSSSCRCCRRCHPSAVDDERAGRPGQAGGRKRQRAARSEEHTSELQSRVDLVCRLLLEKQNLKHDRSII